ncbi:MAG: hypothetical protein MUC83_12130 [Pirellula sp.]|nr:hypothetical protein [Pirellula sp.]
MEIPGLMNVPVDFFKTCDEEPIHNPGSIQPLGAPLAFSPLSRQLVSDSNPLLNSLSKATRDALRIRTTLQLPKLQYHIPTLPVERPQQVKQNNEKVMPY